MIEPRANPLLVGHATAERAFAAAAARGRLHHAWLITGPDGIGKATLAFRLARTLLAGEGDPNDPDDPVFRRTARGTHSDLLTLERAFDEKRKRLRTEIVVEGARDIAGFLRLTPAEGGWRIVVIDGAEHLNRNAANALLKVLEEPPTRAILLLTCAAPGRLLPTIRSRCRRLPLHSLDDPDMRLVLPQILPGEEPDALIAVAGGSPGRAALLAESGGTALAALVDEVLGPGALPVARMHELADKIARSEGAYDTFMDLLRHRLAETVRGAARGRGPHADLGARAEVWHALGRLHDETDRANLDKRHAVLAGLDLLHAH